MSKAVQERLTAVIDEIDQQVKGHSGQQATEYETGRIDGLHQALAIIQLDELGIVLSA